MLHCWSLSDKHQHLQDAKSQRNERKFTWEIHGDHERERGHPDKCVSCSFCSSRSSLHHCAFRNEPHCVIHFYHSNFRRCEIMDKHLAVSNVSPLKGTRLLMDSYQKLAPKYYATRFIRVFVENVPWLVEKLAIKVLPCLMCFIDGVSKDRYVL
jgi:hypothetical protein